MSDRDYDFHTIKLMDGRELEIKIPVPISREDKEQLKQAIPILIDLAIEPPDEPQQNA